MYGMIVRAHNGYQEYYDKDKNEWIKTGVLMLYFCDESEVYDLYEDISEEEALKSIKEKVKL